MKIDYSITLLICMLVAVPSDSQYHSVALKSSIDQVQPLTGIVLWTDNENNKTDAIQLEFSYMLYSDVVREKGVYDWSFVDKLLTAVASRKHQAILRFRFVYPGYETAVPQYIKNLSDYQETKGTSESLTTYFPDWRNEELKRFTLDFYSKFAERYEKDSRLAYIQTGFGLWAEYHIYDGPKVLGRTFPDKQFQADFFRHLDTTFKIIPWSVSIDAADSDLSPFASDNNLKELSFGLFDDSFMHETHSEYNTDCWNFFDRNRFLLSPAGGEFSYYTDYDQQHALDKSGPYNISFENEAKNFHISYMIGNDQPEYQTISRIKEAGLACGYKFRISKLLVSPDSSIVEVVNKGVAPLYYDAFVSINGIRSKESLKNLSPDSSIICHIAYSSQNPVLTIECDRLVAGQQIQYDAALTTSALCHKSNFPVKTYSPGASAYTLNGCRILKNSGDQLLNNSRVSGTYILINRLNKSEIEKILLLAK